MERSIFRILQTSAALILYSGFAAASASHIGRPIEILSDPGGTGRPTKYSIVRGASRVTFSNPIAGQYSRAEILTRNRSGTNLTRFLLSPDGKHYRPTLQLFNSFEEHYSKVRGPECTDETPPGTAQIIDLKPKVIQAEVIAKKRRELEDSKLFDESCFKANVSKEHRDAIFNASAEVFAVAVQNERPRAKYLQCLEDNGFADQSGLMQALIKQSLESEKISPRLRIACTTEPEALPAKYNELTKVITLRIATLPRRDYYATKVFHELLHTVPVRDGSDLQTIEDCCTQDERCEVLKKMGQQRSCGERRITILESFDQATVIATGKATALLGINGDSKLACPSAASKAPTIVNESPTEACRTLGPLKCKAQVEETRKGATVCLGEPMGNFLNAHEFARTNWLTVWSSVANADEDCKHRTEVMPISAKTRLESVIAGNQNTTADELSKTFPQTSPLTFDPPAQAPAVDTATPLRMVEDDAPVKPTRTIASIAPLPDENPGVHLGFSNNRNDVRSGRATVLVDTLERAADKVSKTLTPEKLELLKVDSNQIFSSNFKPKTKNPQYMVASFGTSPITIADIGDVQGLSFPNPFANIKTAGGDSASTSSQKVMNLKTNAAKTAKADGANAAGDSSGLAAAANGNTGAPAANLPTAASAFSSAATSGPPNRVPAGARPNFKVMDHDAIINFLTNSYRAVESHIADHEFIEALARNKIQIVDHERKKIGALRPDLKFEYNEKVQRLVMKRRDRR